MSDKDLISARNEILRMLNYINSSGRLDYEDYCELFDTINREFLVLLKQSRKEMSAREFLNEFERMCKVNGGSTIFKCSTECPIFDKVKGYLLKCEPWVKHHPEEAVAIVEKWAREHPEGVSDAD